MRVLVFGMTVLLAACVDATAPVGMACDGPMLPAFEFQVYPRTPDGVKYEATWQNYFLVPHRTKDTLGTDPRVILSAYYDEARQHPRCLTFADSIIIHTPTDQLRDLLTAP